MVNPISPGSAILAVLRHGPAHGTEICKRAAKLTGNSVKLGQASLYTALSRLEQQRLVSRTIVKREHGGRPAHVYELTDKGKHVSADQLAIILKLFGATKSGRVRVFKAKVAAAKKRRSSTKAKSKANGHAKLKALKAKGRKKPVKKAAGPKLQAPKPAPAPAAKAPTGIPAMFGGPPS